MRRCVNGSYATVIVLFFTFSTLCFNELITIRASYLYSFNEKQCTIYMYIDYSVLIGCPLSMRVRIMVINATFNNISVLDPEYPEKITDLS